MIKKLEISAAKEGIKKVVNKNLAKKVDFVPAEKKALKSDVKMGSCAGMVSWSLNTVDSFNGKAQKPVAEGSCAGMVSWSLNTIGKVVSNGKISA